jgi:His/Glu/Gln/Arg/opine family amino acid ABC transporter permease subunit
MVTAAAARPERGIAWRLRESTPLSLAIFGVGAVALLLVALAVFVYLPLRGLRPVETLIEGFRSPTFQGMLLAGAIVGAIATAGGFLRYRSMPTKISREAAIAGAVLGLQAVLLGLGMYIFARGNRVDIFSTNYFNFDVMEGNYGAFVRGFWNTIFLAGISELIGIALGLVLSVFAISKRAVVRAPARVYINFFRGTPLVWQIVFIGVALPIGLSIKIPAYNAAIIALSLNAGAYVAEVFRAGIQSIERGQIEAARGLGMTYMQAMGYAIIPQAVRRVIPPLMNEFVILLKDTSLVFVLGLTAGQRELMAVGNNLQQNTFNATFLIFTALGYLCVSLPAIRLVNWIERKLRSGLVGISA